MLSRYPILFGTLLLIVFTNTKALPIYFPGPVTLTGTNITFAQTVDSDATARTLAVNSCGGGLTRFDGAVGSTAALASLVTNADGKTEISGGSVTTVSDQTYNDVLTFSNDLVLTGANISLVGGVEIGIGGTMEAQYEQIIANGALFLDGLLDLTLTEGFDPYRWQHLRSVIW